MIDWDMYFSSSAIKIKNLSFYWNRKRLQGLLYSVPVLGFSYLNRLMISQLDVYKRVCYIPQATLDF